MKKSRIKRTFAGLLATGILASLLSGCDRTRTTTGWDYFPDMFYSTAYETYSPNPNFEDGTTMRAPEPGTVPRGYMPFGYTTDPESRILAGKELVNPFAPDAGTLETGKKIYSEFCMVCHGAVGKGDGILFTSGLYPMEPRNLTEEAMISLKDGEIYHTITLGFGSMGAHGAQIRPDDRWKLVSFIRSLQQEGSKTTDKN